MSSCSGNSSACCALILKQYPALSQTIEQTQPDMSSEMIQSLMWLLYLSLNPIYQKVKCGRLFCCEGLIEGIFCAFQTYLTVGGGDIDSLIATINGVLSQANLSLTCDPSGLPNPSSVVFGYTGAEQSLVIPAKVFQIQIVALGAQGGFSSDFQGVGGWGGSATYNISVTPGDLIYLYVGGMGILPTPNGLGFDGGVGGFNGGGLGGAGAVGGGGGGGASDVRIGGNALTDRVVIAGGGGGGGALAAAFGGPGGGTTGATGGGTNANNRGQGGTQSAGGAGAIGIIVGMAGTLGIGGDAGTGDPNNADMFGGGGGGGGYYGGGGGRTNANLTPQPGGGGGGYYGGGGGRTNANLTPQPGGGGGGYYGGGGGRTNANLTPQPGGGGGGSGFTPDGSGMVNNVQSGNGQITITYLCF